MTGTVTDGIRLTWSWEQLLTLESMSQTRESFPTVYSPIPSKSFLPTRVSKSFCQLQISRVSSFQILSWRSALSCLNTGWSPSSCCSLPGSPLQCQVKKHCTFLSPSLSSVKTYQILYTVCNFRFAWGSRYSAVPSWIAKRIKPLTVEQVIF